MSEEVMSGIFLPDFFADIGDFLVAHRIQELFYGGLPDTLKTQMLSQKKLQKRNAGILKPGNRIVREWLPCVSQGGWHRIRSSFICLSTFVVESMSFCMDVFSRFQFNPIYFRLPVI